MYNLKVNDSHFLPHCGCEIEFSLNQGDVVVISGENGLGKSTFLHRIFQQSPEVMSLVSQTPLDLFYDRHLGRIKEVFLIAGGEAIDEDYFLRCWENFGLSQKEDRLQSSLSGGEGQALKLCLGLSVKSSVYLLDEPSQYLDDSSRSILNEILMELIQNKKSLLIVEHDLSWQKFSSQNVEFKLFEQTLKIGRTWNT